MSLTFLVPPEQVLSNAESTRQTPDERARAWLIIALQSNRPPGKSWMPSQPVVVIAPSPFRLCSVLELQSRARQQAVSFD